MRRHKFSLSHYKLFTTSMGYLVPVTWFDVLPGDSIQMSTSALVRCSPMLAPVMHPVKVRIHHFFVPLRQIWEDFEEFITGGEDGTYSCVPPYMTFDNASTYESELPDFLGVIPYDFGGDAGTIDVSALPFRAYQKIWNHYYRDQDLVSYSDVATENGDGGEDAETNRFCHLVSWEKDYFTTCRPTETKGDTVYVPLAEEAYVHAGVGGAGEVTVYSDAQAEWRKLDSDGATVDISATADSTESKKLYADLAAASGVDINDLRLALAIQRYQEARNNYGARYSEYLRYLGVRVKQGVDDPVYLGGGRQVIQFSEVLQTGQDFDANEGVGAMAGHGIAAMRTNRFRRFFDEHGIVMSMMSVIPKPIYSTGLHRSWSRDTKEHYWQRELETVGEQAVLNKEVDARHDTPDGTFGYQRRYDEYRWHPSSIAGEFRSTLDHWHLARIFASDPALNSTFVQCNPSKRVFADTSNDSLYVMCNHSIQARRIVNRFARPLTM